MNEILPWPDEREITEALQSWPDGFALPTLCDACNSHGTNWGFISQYKLWRKAGIDSLQRYCVTKRRPRPCMLVGDEEIELRLNYDRMPGRFARYVVGMFLAAQATERLMVEFPQLVACITGQPDGKSPAPAAISPARLYLAFANRNSVVSRDSTTAVRFALGARTPSGLVLPGSRAESLSEFQLMVFSPFAFTLALSGEPPHGAGLEIAHWTQLGHHARVDRNMKTIIVPALDYEEWLPST